jgi:hypothetical protein
MVRTKDLRYIIFFFFYFLYNIVMVAEKQFQNGPFLLSRDTEIFSL